MFPPPNGVLHEEEDPVIDLTTETTSLMQQPDVNDLYSKVKRKPQPALTPSHSANAGLSLARQKRRMRKAGGNNVNVEGWKSHDDADSSASMSEEGGSEGNKRGKKKPDLVQQCNNGTLPLPSDKKYANIVCIRIAKF